MDTKNFRLEVMTKILRDIIKGIPYKIAAESQDVSEYNFYEWVHKGVKDLNDGNFSGYAAFVQCLRAVQERHMAKMDAILADGK